jgi:hypothetical protein
MRFYNQQHKFYCGIDLHARKMYVCIIDQKGKTRVHQNLNTDPEQLFDIIFPFLEDVAICVECMFSWYWVADFCTEHKIPFVLGHALYMKAIHLYEVHDIKRFGSVQRFCSYARLIRPEKESDGKWAGKSNKKIGNAHLKWAIRTAAMISLRESEQAKKYVDRLTRKHNKGKALGIYTHKLGRAVYFMLKNKRAFDMKHFFNH